MIIQMGFCRQGIPQAYREKTLMEIGKSSHRAASSRLCGMETGLSLFGVLEYFTTACGKLSRLEIGSGA